VPTPLPGLTSTNAAGSRFGFGLHPIGQKGVPGKYTKSGKLFIYHGIGVPDSRRVFVPTCFAKRCRMFLHIFGREIDRNWM